MRRWEGGRGYRPCSRALKPPFRRQVPRERKEKRFSSITVAGARFCCPVPALPPFCHLSPAGGRVSRFTAGPYQEERISPSQNLTSQLNSNINSPRTGWMTRTKRRDGGAGGVGRRGGVDITLTVYDGGRDDVAGGTATLPRLRFSLRQRFARIWRICARNVCRKAATHGATTRRHAFYACCCMQLHRACATAPAASRFAQPACFLRRAAAAPGVRAAWRTRAARRAGR